MPISEEEVAEIRKALFVGNGRPSIMARMEALEHDIRENRAALQKIDSAMRWVVRLLIGTLASHIVQSVMR